MNMCFETAQVESSSKMIQQARYITQQPVSVECRNMKDILCDASNKRLCLKVTSAKMLQIYSSSSG